MSPPEREWSARAVELLKEIQGVQMAMERHRGQIMEHIAAECGALKADIAGLKAQAKVWGAVAGVIASLAVVLIQLLIGGG